MAEHLSKLGEALGLDLELVEREGAVGDFSADIVARDLGRGDLVVIENQLEGTDHSHLGQLLTYAAGLDAGVIVWLSRDFREEHRQAIDWLNRNTATAVHFFGVVIELLKVDESRPAVNFRPVAFPNDWSRKAQSRPGSGEISGKQALYQEFFQRLIDDLRDNHSFTNAKGGQPQNGYTFASGTRGFSYVLDFVAGNRVRAGLYIDTGVEMRNKSVFDQLRDRKDELEEAFGESLIWEPLETRRACRIATYRNGNIEDPPDVREEHLRW
ncbi:MAG: DUF4268 domain-containing protein, partial [Kiloniellaceae bacterium]